MSIVDRRTEELLSKIVSPETGIIKRISLLPVGGGQIPYRHFNAAPASYATLPAGGDISRPGGSALDLGRGLEQVTFEALERYCAAFADYSELIFSAPNSPLFDAGRKQQRFADSQYENPSFPFRPVADDEPIYWVAGRSLVQGTRRFMPAILAYVPYQPTSAAEVLGPSFSTGMASDWCRERALLGGLLEVIERDAFAITWMNRISRPLLRPAPGSTVSEVVAGIEADGSKVTFVDLTTDIDVPVVACIMQRNLFDRPLPTVGLSCKLDRSAACMKALSEAVSEYERLADEMRGSRGTEYWTAAPDYSDVVDFEWHGRAYIDPDMHQHLDFLLDGSGELEIDGEPKFADERDLNATVSKVANHVDDIVAVELTTRDIAEFGVRVVKVFVPDLVPLHADHKFPYLAHKRLINGGGLFPDRTAEEALAALNPYPHPFS